MENIPKIKVKKGSLKEGSYDYVKKLFGLGYNPSDISRITGLSMRHNYILKGKSPNWSNNYRIFSHGNENTNPYFRYRLTLSNLLVTYLENKNIICLEIDIENKNNLRLTIPELDKVDHLKAVYITGQYKHLKSYLIRYNRVDNNSMVEFLLGYPDSIFVSESFEQTGGLFSLLEERIKHYRANWKNFCDLVEEPLDDNQPTV
jgi:hypothetical protein